jgi:hypothetical protein
MCAWFGVSVVWMSSCRCPHCVADPYTGSTSTYAYQGNYPENPHNKVRLGVLCPCGHVPFQDVLWLAFLHQGFSRLKTQGILALADTRKEDGEQCRISAGRFNTFVFRVVVCGCSGVVSGGFQAVPGFHKHIQKWGELHPEIRKWYTYPAAHDETTMQVPYEDPIRNFIQPMPMRKGSLLVWNSAIPHGTFPNNSSHPRLVQYLKMAPVSDPAIVPAAKNSTSGHNTVFGFGPHHLPTKSRGFYLTHLGERLMGFRDWLPGETGDQVIAMN